MAILYPPDVGMLLLCDFRGTIPPEMNKKRPVVILAAAVSRLCVVVPLSTSHPGDVRPWHYELLTPDPLPAPYSATRQWVKGDMVSTVSYDRLFLPFVGKDAQNKRIYANKRVSAEDLERIRLCVASVICPNLID